MSAVDQIKKDFQLLSDRLKELTAERDRVEGKIRDTKAQLGELEATLRVLRRYETTPAQLDLVQGRASARPVTVDDAMRFALNALPGNKVNELAEAAEKHYSIKINLKSAGNALWRMKKAGEARRDGQNWWPVEKKEPQDAGTSKGSVFDD